MTPLRRLAQAHGVALRYHDIFGTLHEASDATLRALLGAIGIDASTDSGTRAALGALARRRWATPLAPLVVLRQDGSRRVRLQVPADVDVSSLRARITTDEGGAHEGAVARAERIEEATIDGRPLRAWDVAIRVDAPVGYHRLALLAGDEEVAAAQCAVAPRACHRPAALRPGARAFGAAVQLYGVRSRRNWGIGDFTDLADLVGQWGARGAGIVGVNPLHALYSHNPAHASPYSPSSRLFANPLYLDVESIDDHRECDAARTLVASPAFRSRLDALRAAPLVDYAAVATCKREVLELLYGSFRERHLARPTPRGREFEAFVRDGGEALNRHALFEALQEHCFALDASAWGWPAWPERFRDPDGIAVVRFARSHADRVGFHAYLQWQADVQRARVAARATQAGLAVGLYTDLAVSIDRGGAEAWANQRLYAVGASVGAPPDAFNAEGQQWGLPPLVPSRLVDAGYAPFIATLRANMRHAGALRIDHVMGLMRLFWVPEGRRPAEGAYVHYPFDDLMALLALESERQRCLVIGEDLGTVPDEVRRVLVDNDVLSYRVLLFERDAAGEFKPPDAYPEAALATASTHDLPTLAGWWEARDIELRASLGLVANDDRRREEWTRGEDRARLLRALERAGLLPEGSRADPEAFPTMTPALAEAILAFLAATPSVLEVVQLEDALRVVDQANLPGTVDEHPNWRRRLPVDLEHVFDDSGVAAIVARLASVRTPAARA